MAFTDRLLPMSRLRFKKAASYHTAKEQKPRDAEHSVE